ncbi:hypothetical protein CBL_06154 [Carabus blaptoides fortunei]
MVTPRRLPLTVMSSTDDAIFLTIENTSLLALYKRERHKLARFTIKRSPVEDESVHMMKWRPIRVMVDITRTGSEITRPLAATAMVQTATLLSLASPYDRSPASNSWCSVRFRERSVDADVRSTVNAAPLMHIHTLTSGYDVMCDVNVYPSFPGPSLSLDQSICGHRPVSNETCSPLVSKLVTWQTWKCNNLLEQWFRTSRHVLNQPVSN